MPVVMTLRHVSRTKFAENPWVILNISQATENVAGLRSFLPWQNCKLLQGMSYTPI